MKLGIHAYAYCSQWSNETIDLIDRVKKLGLDFIEIPLNEIPYFANAVSALKIKRKGAMNIPDRREVEDFIKKNK